MELLRSRLRLRDCPGRRQVDASTQPRVINFKPSLEDKMEVSILHSCPFCSSTNTRRIDNLTYSGACLFSSTPIDIKDTPELWACGACHSFFVNKCLSKEVVQQLYDKGCSNKRWGSAPFEKTATRETLRCIQDVIEPGTKILDFGANSGDFLDYARQCGATKTIGVELSASSRKELGERGHSTYASLDPIKEQVDLVTMFDVIEHLHSPSDLIKQIYNILSDNGKLIVLTGDISSKSAKAANASWWYYNYPEHIVFPSLSYFDTLPGFAVHKIIHTYASAQHKPGILNKIKACFFTANRKNYSGIPPLDRDHILVVLTKKSTI